MTKRYIGDSVYADFDGYHIVLTTENGYGPSNTIKLEPAVIDALQTYIRATVEESARAAILGVQA